MSTFCQRSYHRKFQRRKWGGYVGGQKSQNLVNVVCERPLYMYSAATATRMTLQKIILKKNN